MPARDVRQHLVAVHAVLSAIHPLRPAPRPSRQRLAQLRRPRARGHGRLEAPVDAPLAATISSGAAPEADREAGEVGRAERRRLGDRGPDDGHAEQVGLELHEQVVGGRAAVDAQLGERDARVALHRVEQVGDLEGDALERRARDVRRRWCRG